MLLNRMYERIHRLPLRIRLLRRRARLTAERTPVVLVPSILGTRLADPCGRLAWGSARRLYFGPPLGDDPGIHAAGLLRGFTVIPGLLDYDVFGGMLRFLTGVGGYVLGEDLQVFEYDWRGGVTEVGEQLAELLERLRACDARSRRSRIPSRSSSARATCRRPRAASSSAAARRSRLASRGPTIRAFVSHTSRAIRRCRCAAFRDCRPSTRNACGSSSPTSTGRCQRIATFTASSSKRCSPPTARFPKRILTFAEAPGSLSPAIPPAPRAARETERESARRTPRGTAFRRGRRRAAARGQEGGACRRRRPTRSAHSRSSPPIRP